MQKLQQQKTEYPDQQETVAKNRRGRLWWWLLGLLLLSIAGYSGFPYIASTVLTEALTQQGFTHVSIRLGYPTTHSLPIHMLTFQKDIAEASYQGTFHNIEMTYQLPQLFDGQLAQIVIGNGELAIKPVSSKPPAEQAPASFSAPHSPSFTIDEMLLPFPRLPFEQLIIGHIAIDRSLGDDPLQHIRVDGTVDTRQEALHTHFFIQGANIPDYDITLSGTSIGDISLAMLSPASTPPTLARMTSHATRIADTVQVQGSLDIDIPNVIKLVKLFVPIERDFLQMSGTIIANWNGTIPHSVTINSLVREKVGALDGTFQVRAALPQFRPYGQHIDVKVNGTFAATHDTISWKFSKDSEASSTVLVDQLPIPDPLRTMIPRTGHHLSIRFPKPLSGRIDLNTTPPSLNIDGLILSRYHIQDFPVDLECSLTQMAGSSMQNLSANGTYAFSGTVDTQLEPDLPIKHLQWKLSGELSVRKEKLAASLAPQSSLRMSLLPINEILIPQADLTFTKKFTATYNLKDQQWETNPLFLRINTPEISWKDQAVAIQQAKVSIHELQGSLSTWQTSGEMVLLGISTTIQDVTPPTTNWKFQFSANPHALLVNLLGQTSDTQVSLYGRLHQDVTTRKGSFHMKLAPVTFSPSAFNLRTSITPWTYPLDITTGQISAKAEAFWTLPRNTDQQPVSLTRAQADLNVDHLGGHYENIIFDGLSTAMTVVGTDTWSMPAPGTLTLAKVETGVTISNISMNFLLNHIPNSSIPRANIRMFSAEMFAGNVSSDAFVFDASQSRTQLTVHAQGLDIGAILNLEQQEGLHGTGLIDGTIPVLLTDNGVEVHNGKLAARPPGGMIRYQTAEGTAKTLKQTSKDMNLVLQALNNFHYDALTVGVDYDHTGKLLLATKIKGKNPNLHRGKPIHFNLNVEENIPALLQSLQVAKDIEGTIDELIQSSGEKLIQGL
ncbi:MAG: hypothetical protein NPIRA02_37330 [Nitrospirales bacterium]|nr:MAG: hypothetical protein NPIRA02_37330 [Nitrospirales bacterium]